MTVYFWISHNFNSEWVFFILISEFDVIMLSKTLKRTIKHRAVIFGSEIDHLNVAFVFGRASTKIQMWWNYFATKYRIGRMSVQN